MKNKIKFLPVLLVIAAVFTSNLNVFAQADMKETINQIKANLAESKEKIKKYEWIETTTTFYKGEQKSKKQNQCYYGVDGKLTKVETGGSDEAKKKGGLRGKIAENKKEEMADYISSAIKKIHAYLPPDGAKLQEIYTGGKTAVNVLEPAKKFKIDFPGYLEQGDMLSISIDKEHNKIMAVSVSTFVEDPAEKVVFDIKYSSLPDGTQYPGAITLDAQAKNVKIVIENSGHKKAAQ